MIDLYSIKPLDAETLRAAAEATGGRLVAVEDHWPEGGLGDAVLAAVADADEPPRVVKLAVHGMPTSGKPEELLAAAGIDAASIADAARRLVAQTVPTAKPSGRRHTLGAVESAGNRHSIVAGIAAIALAVGALALLWGASEAHFRGCVEEAAARYPPIAVSASGRPDRAAQGRL